VVVAVLAVAAGCTRDAAPTAFSADATPPVDIARTATSALSDAAPAPTSSAAATTPPPSAAAVPTAPVTTAPTPDATTTLTAALDTLATGYHFVTTATVAGRVAVVAEGDHVAGATQMIVTSGGASTRYLITSDAAWAQADGEWHQLDSAQGLRDPIDQLRAPLSVTLVGTADAATITAHYPAAALGLPGDGQHAVELQLANGLIRSLRYASTAVVTNADGTTSEQASEVTAQITPIASGTQITLPAAEA
jgi:hypothetical protein